MCHSALLPSLQMDMRKQHVTSEYHFETLPFLSISAGPVTIWGVELGMRPGETQRQTGGTLRLSVFLFCNLLRLDALS